MDFTYSTVCMYPNVHCSTVYNSQGRDILRRELNSAKSLKTMSNYFSTNSTHQTPEQGA